MKWYKWLAVVLGIVLLLGGSVYIFNVIFFSKKVSSMVSTSAYSDISDSLETPDHSPTDTSLALFMHQMHSGTVLSQPLFTSNKVSFASTAAHSGEASLLGKALSDGLFLYLNNNTHGAHTISLDIRDDHGNILKTVEHVGDLLDSRDIFFATMGDESVEKVYMPLLEKQKAALFFPVAGIRPSHFENLPLVFLRPSYAQEVQALVYYATHILKQKKIAVFFEESTWGHEAKNAVHAALGQHGITLAAAASYQPGTVNIDTALASMQRAEPHVIICIASARPAYNFIREAINKKLHYVSFLGISRLTHVAEHLKQSRGATLVTSSVVPNPHNSQLPIVAAYRKDMQQFLPNKGLTTTSLEGYINSALLSYMVQQLPSDATISDLWHALQSIQNMTFKGMSLDYHRGTLSHTVWINEGNEHQWHEYTVRNI